MVRSLLISFALLDKSWMPFIPFNSRKFLLWNCCHTIGFNYILLCMHFQDMLKTHSSLRGIQTGLWFLLLFVYWIIIFPLIKYFQLCLFYWWCASLTRFCSVIPRSIMRIEVNHSCLWLLCDLCLHGLNLESTTNRYELFLSFIMWLDKVVSTQREILMTLVQNLVL